MSENKRRPASRINGRYTGEPEGLENFVINIVKEYTSKYPDIDIIDLEVMFTREFGYQMARQLARESESVI